MSFEELEKAENIDGEENLSEEENHFNQYTWMQQPRHR
ncbi:unnamed protein product, partial [marine sediment metagenome]